MTKPRKGVLIPVRLTSERLPGKGLRDLVGQPVLYHLLDRVKASPHVVDPADIVVCTTTDAEDDRLTEAVQAYGASVFRGSRDDIIARFHAAMEQFDFDAVIQVNGDNPLTDTLYMTLTMDRLLADPSLDIVVCRDLPLGTASCSFTRRAMDKVMRHYRSDRNDTGFVYFFTRTGICKVGTVDPVSPDHILPDARLTLDYPVDFALFQHIFATLQPPDRLITLTEVVQFLHQHPEWRESNIGVDKDYWERTRQKAVLEYVDADGVRKSIHV